jgi:hypothetical protein
MLYGGAKDEAVQLELDPKAEAGASPFDARQAVEAEALREEAAARIAEELLEGFRRDWGGKLGETDAASKLLQSLGGSGLDLDPQLTQTAGCARSPALRRSPPAGRALRLRLRRGARGGSWEQLQKLQPLLESDQMRQFEALIRRLGRGGTRGRRRRARLQKEDRAGANRVVQASSRPSASPSAVIWR